MNNRLDNKSPDLDKAQKHQQGFGIAASPFNGVKLELGIALIMGLVVWLVADIITPVSSSQLLILFVYSLIAMIWLMLRTRRVLRVMGTRDQGGHQP